jgi:hypothetical protein
MGGGNHKVEKKKRKKERTFDDLAVVGGPIAGNQKEGRKEGRQTQGNKKKMEGTG